MMLTPNWGEVVLVASAFAAAMILMVWLVRQFGPYSGWAKSAQCQRCGFILHGFDTPSRSRDGTCEKCGPYAPWKFIYAKPVGLWGYKTQTKATAENLSKTKLDHE